MFPLLSFIITCLSSTGLMILRFIITVIWYASIIEDKRVTALLKNKWLWFNFLLQHPRVIFWNPLLTWVGVRLLQPTLPTPWSWNRISEHVSHLVKFGLLRLWRIIWPFFVILPFVLKYVLLTALKLCDAKLFYGSYIKQAMYAYW